MTIINKAIHEEQIDMRFQEIEEIWERLKSWKSLRMDKELGRKDIYQLISEKEWAMHSHPKHDTPTWPW